MPGYTMTTEQINHLMLLQMRRDFLKRHALHISNMTQTTFNLVVDQSLDNPTSRTEEQNVQLHLEFLKKEIKTFEAYLTATNDARFQHYLKGVLLPKVGKDSDGISTNLSRHFAQLQAASVADIESARPFVQLTAADGLCFYWKTPGQAQCFSDVLLAHGFQIQVGSEKLPAAYLPAGVASLPDYQSNQTSVVKVLHRQVEQLLALAQYNIDQADKTIEDLYLGKMDRTAVLLEEANHVTDLSSNASSDVGVTNAERISLSDKEDLIAVSIGARAPKMHVQTKPHIVLIIDDSGSMSGDKMVATNRALNTLIQSLPDDTLVSMQTLNTQTLACRMPAKELKKQMITIPASGGTPLLETIVASAAFFRPHPLDLVIPKEEFDRTTLVVLTDGQPNGGVGDTISKLMTSMREGVGVGRLVGYQQLLVTPSTGFPAVDISFGSKDNPCRQDPVVLGFCIGHDADTQFMQDLSRRFATPQGFIRTDKNLDADMSEAMTMIANIQGRHDKAIVGLTYTEEGRSKAQQKVMTNLFYGRERIEFFRVPKGAPVSVTLIHGNEITKGLPCKASDNGNALRLFIREQFERSKMEYESKALQLKQNSTNPVIDDATKALWIEELKIEMKEIVVTSRRGFAAPIAKDKADYTVDAEWIVQSEKLAEFAKREELALQSARQAVSQVDTLFADLRKSIKEQITQLMSLLPKGSELLAQEMDLFINNMQVPTTIAGYQAVTSMDGRKAVAAFSQLRQIGAALPQDSVFLAIGQDAEAVKVLREKIQQNQFDEALKMIQASPNLLSFVDDTTGTVLHFTLHELLTKVSEALKSFFNAVCALVQTDVCRQDAKGNTIAHKAAWWGMKDQVLMIMKQANERGQLQRLLQIRNTTHVGGTSFGETVLDNVRMSPNLSEDDKKEILQALRPSIQCDTFEACLSADCNAHVLPSWNTPLMMAVGFLNSAAPEDKDWMEQEIITYIANNRSSIQLDEANFNGNTALHFAFWNGQYRIASAILGAANSQGKDKLDALLASRNRQGETHLQAGATAVHSGGEVPHMNLVAQLGQLNIAHVFAVTAGIIEYFVEHHPIITNDSGYDIALSGILNADDPMGSSMRALSLIMQLDGLPQEIREGYQSLLNQLQVITCWAENYAFMQDHLTPTAKTELGHLYTVYEKELEGYCAFNFLQQAPLNQLNDKLAMVRRIRVLPAGMDGLADTLEEVVLNMNLEYVDATQKWIEAWLRSNPLQTHTMFGQDSSFHELLKGTSSLLSQLAHYQQKDPASSLLVAESLSM